MSQPPPIWFVDELPHLAVMTRRLANGLEVVVHRDDDQPDVVVGVAYRVGSSDERPDRTGMAHLFEHLFKGPPRWLGNHHYEILKRAGGSGNAGTDADRTLYYEQLPAHHIELALWLESGRMGYFASDFDPERLTTQQAVVRSERRQTHEVVPYGVERFAIGEALYGDGHPLRHLTIGRHADIQAVTVDEVVDFYRTWYVPANATIVVAGAAPDNIDDLIDHYFASFPSSHRPPRAAPPTPPPVHRQVVVEDPFAVLTRIHRVWIGPPVFGTDEPALDVLASGWSAVGIGALWRRLVYERELAQRVSCWTVNTRLGGEFHVAVDLRSGADRAAVRDILDDATTGGLDEQTIARLVTRREAGVLWGLTQVARRMRALQRYALYLDRPASLADDLARYRALDARAIASARGRWLTADHCIEVETVPAGGR